MSGSQARFRLSLLLVTLVAAPLTVTGGGAPALQNAAAQQTGITAGIECGLCINFLINNHFFGAVGGSNRNCLGTNPGTDDGCHTETRVGVCTTSHWPCPFASAQSWQRSDPELLALRELVERSDWVGVADYVEGHEGIVFNGARRSIQAVDCRGGVVANLPVAALVFSGDQE